MLSLKIEDRKSIFENKVFIEHFDITILKKLICYPKLEQQQKEYLKSILHQVRKNNEKLKVTYSHKNILFGRVYANKTSYQSLSKSIRHTLGNSRYVDVDMVNCQPTILYYLCRANRIYCPKLEWYVNNRENAIKISYET